MKKAKLQIRIIRVLIPSILTLGIIAVVTGWFVINGQTVVRAQKQVVDHLNAARSLYDDEAKQTTRELLLVAAGRAGITSDVRNQLGLDFLIVLDRNSPELQMLPGIESVFSGTELTGNRIMKNEIAGSLSNNTLTVAPLIIVETPRARASDKSVLDSILVMETAVPYEYRDGKVLTILYGGMIMNRSTGIVDKIRDYVFAMGELDGKPLGTVTIFQDDVRISTNVIDSDGKRAIGTRVSEEVYNRVILNKDRWLDRAFVVDDWYLTAYEPILDYQGNAIGILYVGALERQYSMVKVALLLLLVISLGSTMIIALVISLVIIRSFTRPVYRLKRATEIIADGGVPSETLLHSSVAEFEDLGTAFGVMQQKLAVLHKHYLDLVGFVAHELKGIMATTMLNAYTVRDGYLGMINFKQRKALDAVTRNLEYFDTTVRNFLNISRIEKKELHCDMQPVLAKDDIFDQAVDSFKKQASEKGMTIENYLPGDLCINADITLMQIVANNLVGNAVKYGVEKGLISLQSDIDEKTVEISVYNDGPVIPEDKLDTLFKKFSRLTDLHSRKIQGTGLGLYITREIIEQHGGTITVVPGEKGNSFVITLPRNHEEDKAC
jgi:two-component system NtrC family sensor kinase